ncbi:hypothetical protein [uncultured Winogradskyella sp.]|uniref:hypothetical protein n=1 Tax=uncultured Winogradskyella sp. TaxID=395353 RepID=UPI002615C9B6|nr:hypothetical protein [uncultured Winogradskyella sp.]
MCQSYGQEKSIEIDYVVDYEIPSKRNSTVDTISIGFNKDGKYIWTNHNALALSLAKSLVKNSSQDYSKAESDLILDTEEGILTLIFKLDRNIIFFSLSLETFLPNSNEEDLDLITEDSGEIITVLEKEIAVYNMFPSNKPEDVISIATDKAFNVNNNLIFKKFFEIAFKKSGFSDNSAPTIPSGLIMKIMEDGNTMIEAVKVDNTKKTIKINYSFKITE